MLTHDSPQGLLDYVREQRKLREYNQTSERNTDISTNVSGTIQSNESNDRGYENSRHNEASAIYGTNGASEYVSTSERNTTYKSGQSNRETGRRDTSIYQHETGTGKYGETTSTFTSKIKNILTPFVDVFKNQKQAEKASKKKTEQRKLSDIEAIKLKPRIIEFLTWTTDNIDNFIIATTKGHDETIVIWSDMQEGEIEILADFFIQRGKNNGQSAQLVRNMAVFMERIKLAVIIAPRMYKTAMAYIERGISLR